MTKAGGTTLNGMLANAYHGVCGHKGYSLLGSTSTEISNGQYTCVDQCFSTGRFSCIWYLFAFIYLKGEPCFDICIASNQAQPDWYHTWGRPTQNDSLQFSRDVPVIPFRHPSTVSAKLNQHCKAGHSFDDLFMTNNKEQDRKQPPWNPSVCVHETSEPTRQGAAPIADTIQRFAYVHHAPGIKLQPVTDWTHRKEEDKRSGRTGAVKLHVSLT